MNEVKGTISSIAHFAALRLTMLHNYAYGSSAEGP